MTLDDFNVQTGNGPPPGFDSEVKWSQTFQVSNLDFQAQSPKQLCRISGNPLLPSSDALPLVKAFMELFNERHHGYVCSFPINLHSPGHIELSFNHFVMSSSLFSCRKFTLVRVVNVVKREDAVQGSRYLLELELEDRGGQLLRLSHYIYSLMGHNKDHEKNFSTQQPEPQLLLCNPVGFHWNPAPTVNFIITGASTFIPAQNSHYIYQTFPSTSSDMFASISRFCRPQMHSSRQSSVQTHDMSS